MKNLKVFIELNGDQVFVGDITGNNQYDAVFSYSEEYIQSGFPSISISLPTHKRCFSALETRNYFEGLLPEGFARTSVSNWIHASEDDYLSILQVLGSECLGAIRISDETSYLNGYSLLSIDDVKALAREGISKSTELITEARMSLTGASGKVGLYYDSEKDMWYKPIGMAPSTHIVKQSHVRLSSIVINEQICLNAALKLGIDIPKSFIVNTGDRSDSDILFATERYDRKPSSKSKTIDGLRCPFRLHQEDFAQALGISAAKKYEIENDHYLEKIFDLIRNYSVNPIDDQLKLWDILIYDFLVGNTDNHIKNFSLLYSEDLKRISLAPAYDIISTTIYAGSNKNMAIAINGECNIYNLSEGHFANVAHSIGFSEKMALNRFRNLADKFEKAIKEASLEISELGYVEALSIGERILANGGYHILDK